MRKKSEVMEIIEKTILGYGFEVELENTGFPNVKRKNDSYISITIRKQEDPETFDFEKRTSIANIVIDISVCQMGGAPDINELKKAADEIKKGAELVEELRKMELSYLEQH